MDDARIQKAVESTSLALQDYHILLRGYTGSIKGSVREDCLVISQGVSLNLTSSETELTRAISLIASNAEFHILRAYHYASPSLIAILLGIYTVVLTVINIITIINEFSLLITGETLAYWLDQLIPGFAEVWKGIMNKVSEFSAALGWGVDGVHHLLNVAHTGADLWGMVTGKPMDAVNVEKFQRTKILLDSYSTALSQWQSNPGAQISKYAEEASSRMYWGGYVTMHDITDKLGEFGDTAKKALEDVGSISSELLAIRDDMPSIIAKNIPSGIWDGILRVDTTINDRILPALTDILDKIGEVDAVLEAHRKKAEELADKIAHPGDMLSEINKLPGYARDDQLGKIDNITSEKMRQANEADFAAVEPDLREFALTAKALTQPPAPLEFMLLELPGRSPGIVAEHRETWFVGDY